jgi:uridine kinase
VKIFTRKPTFAANNGAEHPGKHLPMTPFLIGITGGSGSGKSSFIRSLRANFSEDDLCIVSMDDYYLPREDQHTDERGEKNFDLPESFDKKAFRHDLERLMSGETVVKEEYTFNTPGAKAKLLTFRPAPVIIVEGLFVFHYKKIKPLFKLKVFINAKENLKVIRRIYRDQVERGYPIDDVLYKYQYHVLPSYERYIQPYKEEADIVVNNNADFEGGLAVLSSFIRSKLDR